MTKEAFAAIALVMAVSCAFGYAMHGILDEARQSHTEPPGEPQGHACETCKYTKTLPTEDPCVECVTDDHDRWEQGD